MGLQTGSIFSDTNYGIPEGEELLQKFYLRMVLAPIFVDNGRLELVTINIYLPIMALNISTAFLLLTPSIKFSRKSVV